MTSAAGKWHQDDLQEQLRSARAAGPWAGVAHQPWQAEVISKPHTHQAHVRDSAKSLHCSSQEDRNKQQAQTTKAAYTDLAFGHIMAQRPLLLPHHTAAGSCVLGLVSRREGVNVQPACTSAGQMGPSWGTALPNTNTYQHLLQLVN